MKVHKLLFACLPLLSTSGLSLPSPSSIPAAHENAFQFPDDFLFGVATAPGHAEDKLEDTWLEFAQNGRVSAWKNQGHPELRLNFWSEYKTEVDYAKQLGIQVFRLGVDWGRLVPEKPKNLCPQSSIPCYEGVQNQAALAHYREMIHYIRAQGMVPMVTLFHHSVPRWLNDLRYQTPGGEDQGGWTHSETPAFFEAFARDVVKALAEDVDLWVIFNESNVFASLAYGAGIWPPALSFDIFANLRIGNLKGRVYQAMDRMIDAHHRIYQMIKETDQVMSGDTRLLQYGPATVGVAHNIGYYTAENFTTRPLASYMRSYMNHYFLDGIVEKLDFIGLNYYGEERVGPLGPRIHEDREYSESGRGVNPYGLYKNLKIIADRYLKSRSIPIFITENGISDGTDVLRPAYLVEHLTAISRAMQEGIPIMGYIFWTLSDNWEWSDGYCPKFGLLEVDRTQSSLPRKARPSFALYQSIIARRVMSEEQRQAIWSDLSSKMGQPRPFCRSQDGVKSLDDPRPRPIVKRDWRFPSAERVLELNQIDDEDDGFIP